MPRNPESLFWDKVRPLLSGLDPVRIENSVSIGTPDVNITLGWIELKQVSALPARADTIIGLKHYTPEQRIFQLRRNRAKSGCWLLLYLAGEWLLFDSKGAFEAVGKCNAEGTRNAACFRWTSSPSRDEFQKALHQSMYPRQIQQ